MMTCRSLPIALVAIGQLSMETAAADEEGRCALRLLERALPPDVLRVRCPVSGPAALVSAAIKGADQAGLSDVARVLLLAHDRATPAPEAFIRLAATLDAGASAACARSQHCPSTEASPDYLTLRGMERFALRATDLETVSPCYCNDVQPPAMLTTVGALRSGAWMQNAVWVPGAYLHDFSGYRSGKRMEIIPLVPEKVRRVLDVGGGEGGFLAAIKAARPCETHLVEFSAPACRVAADVVDTVWQGDFLALPLPHGFDCITFLDVLEHVTDPDAWLVRAGELLALDGVVIISIPNVGHWSVVADLLEGRWDYAPAGIHCITHLRFFTRSSVISLLCDAGFVPARIETQRIDPPPWFDASIMGRSLAIDKDSLATYAFLIVAHKKNGKT